MTYQKESADKGTRAFIAYMLPLEIAALLHKKLQRLGAAEQKPVNWTPPQNYHLTLRFLGNSTADQLEQVARELREELTHFHSFLCMSGGVEYYPNDNHPRVMALQLHSGRRMTDLHSI